MAVCEQWGELLWRLAGLQDPEGEAMFTHYARMVRDMTRDAGRKQVDPQPETAEPSSSTERADGYDALPPLSWHIM